MEEKLYFKPASYGKGTKNKPVEQAVGKDKGDKSHRLRSFIIVASILAIIIAIIIWLLRGKTTTTGEKIPNIKSTSVSCTSKSVVYPFFTYDGAKSRELNVKMVFSEEKLKSISLDYSLFYDSSEVITASEAHNHAEMNKSFGKSGLNPDSYDAKYTILSDRVRMSLYTTEKKLDEVAKRYFLVETDDSFPTSASALRKNYEKQGLSCKDSE